MRYIFYINIISTTVRKPATMTVIQSNTTLKYCVVTD